MQLPRLTDEEIRWMEKGLEEEACTLTPYWHSRIRPLIEEVKESRALIAQVSDELRMALVANLAQGRGY